MVFLPDVAPAGYDESKQTLAMTLDLNVSVKLLDHFRSLIC